MSKEFEQWKEDYGFKFKPNYSGDMEIDCINAFKAGQEHKRKEIDELKRLVSDAIKGIEIELRYATSMGHEQAVKAYQNSLDSLIQCKSFK